MVSMKEIKRRRGSIQSTKQITKAMKLVSTVKLQKARARAESLKPYSDLIYDTIRSMLEKSARLEHRYLKSGGGKKAVIVITANRGLAGGYNNNIIKLTASSFSAEESIVFAIGKKGRDGLERRGFAIGGSYNEVIEDPMYADAADITTLLLQKYEEGEIGEIHLVYTEFKNTVVHVPVVKRLLPIDRPLPGEGAGEERKPAALMNYEPGEEEVLEAIIPGYIASLIFASLRQAQASENGARMTAMDNATSNADELIEDLGLLYNRARQGAITQELTEIVAGANAIE